MKNDHKKLKQEKKGKNSHFPLKKTLFFNNSNEEKKAYKTLVKRQFCKITTIFNFFVKIFKLGGLSLKITASTPKQERRKIRAPALGMC